MAKNQVSAVEILEADKEKLLRQLSAAETPEAAKPVLEKELERILYRLNENCTNERVREAAVGMIGTARAMSALVDSVGEVEIWAKSDQAGASKRRGREHFLFLPVLIAGIALAVGGFAVTLTGAPDVTKLVNAPLVLTLFAGALALMYLAGRLKGSAGKADAKREQMTRTLVDAEKIYRGLKIVMLTIDRNLEEVRSDAEYQKTQNSSGAERNLQAGDLAVYSGLLEAAYSGDSEYAFDKLNELKGFLHSKNIEVVDYSADHAAWFDRMPSMKSGTIRPALASEGKLLKKGLASAGF